MTAKYKLQKLKILELFDKRYWKTLPFLGFKLKKLEKIHNKITHTKEESVASPGNEKNMVTKINIARSRFKGRFAALGNIISELEDRTWEIF